MAKVVFRQVGSALVAHLSGEIDHHAAESCGRRSSSSWNAARWSICVWILGALGLWIPRAWG